MKTLILCLLFVGIILIPSKGDTLMVVGGNVELTTFSSPTSCSTTSSAAITFCALNGTGFAGAKESALAPAQIPRSSLDGITWSDAATNPFTGVVKEGFAVIGSRWLTYQSLSASACVVWYSDDSGTSWSSVDLSSTGMAECRNNNTHTISSPKFECTDTTCIAIGDNNTTAGSAHLVIARSLDSGTTWNQVYLSSGLYSSTGIAYHVGSTIIVTGRLPASNNQTIVSSTDNGTTWTTYIETVASAQLGYAIKWTDGTFYLVDVNAGTGVVTLWTSTTFITWSSRASTPTFSPSITPSTLVASLAYFPGYTTSLAYMARTNSSGQVMIYTSPDLSTFTRICTGTTLVNSYVGNWINKSIPGVLSIGSSNDVFYQIQ